MEKFRVFQQGGGNLTRAQFLRWPSVPKGKASLPPKPENFEKVGRTDGDVIVIRGEALSE